MSKEELNELQWSRNGDFYKLMKSEAGKVRSLKNYVTYLKVKAHFPYETRELRHNTITLGDWEDFIRDPNSTRLIEPTVDKPSNPVPGLAGSSVNSSFMLNP